MCVSFRRSVLFFSSRRRHTRFKCDWSSDVCSSDVVGDRSAEGRDWYRRYWESSVDVPGEAFDEIAAIAREAEVYLVIGVIERDGGTLYCSVLFFAPDGEYLGKHRKLVPTASERLIWGQGDGSTMPVFDTEVGRIGAAICWENYMPLYRTALYAKGIQ